jgi:diguanylate cyclase (GGDEF)-like protein/PAS domain S-box-containing protein
MSIRQVFAALVAVFMLVSTTAGLWQLADSRAKVRAVAWTQLANRMVDRAQQASARLAMERGITAAILANPAEATADMRGEMLAVRSAVDAQHAQLAALTEELYDHARAHPLLLAIADMRETRTEMLRQRAQVDEQLRGVANELDAERWIALMTGRIEALQTLAAISMLPLHDNIYTYASLPIIRDVLFTLSEYLGRERAAIGVAIVRGRPLSESELRTLDDYRMVVTRARMRSEAILAYLPMTPALERARSVFEEDLLSRYEALRASVYASSREGRPYPVDAHQWYREATAGIDAVLGLSSAVSDEFGRNIDRLHRDAAHTMLLLAMIVVVLTILFAVCVQAMRKRVLRPLKALERAAAAISRGDLLQPLRPERDDEFGRVARSFERMRETLVADIRQREADAEELRKLKALIEHSASAMIITDVNGTVEYVNARFVAITGYTRDEANGHKAGFWRSGMTSIAEYDRLWDTVLNGRVWEGELINRRKNGEPYWASVSISPVFDKNGDITHFIGIQNDISERRRIEERLNFLSSYDELTGLPNQNLLAQRFGDVCGDARRNGLRVALVCLGIRRFKQINDNLGRSVGDEFLKVVARRLCQCAGSHEMVSRHGGTEFIMVATRLQQSEDVGDLLERVVDTVRLPVVIDGETLQPVVSAGCSVMPDDGGGFEALLRKATVALHHAERQGLNHATYAESLDVEAQERLALENALRLSLDRNGLELHYQPKVDLVSGRMVGAEALARWRHPLTNEYISPERFIPIAEESGLIQFLGAWALREACRQNRVWQRQGLPPIVVAVNLSAAQLRDAGLPELVADVLHETGLDPALLELELTESALMEDPDEANAVLRRLKQLGLRLAIDDFGTGYSSLAYLGHFPVDQLKIDRRFIKDVTSDPAAAAISTSVVALAHRMGIKVIAEGVENEDQLAFLQRHGCDALQGYYYSPPVVPERLAALLESDRRLAAPVRRLAARTTLVVADPVAVATVGTAIMAHGYRVLAAESGAAAFEQLASDDVQVIIVDIDAAGTGGTELLARVRSLHPGVVRVAICDATDNAATIEAVNSGAIYKILTRPLRDDLLAAHLADAFRRHEVLARRRSASSVFEPI